MAHANAVGSPKRAQCRRCGLKHHPLQRCPRSRTPATPVVPGKSDRKLLPKLEEVEHASTKPKQLVIGLPTRRRIRTSQSPASPQQSQFNGIPKDVFLPEPFNAYPIPTIGVVHKMTEHFVRVWALQQGKPFAFEGHPNPYLSLVFPYILQDADAFEAFICLSRASFLMDQELDVVGDRALAYHYRNSKIALAKRLDSPATRADDTTLLVLAAVASSDFNLGEHSSAQQYVNIIRQIKVLRGEIKTDTAWNKFLSNLATVFEKLWMFVSMSTQERASSPVSAGSSPRSSAPSGTVKIGLPVYAAHPFSPEFCANLSKVPQTISDMAVNGLLSIQIVQIIGQLPRRIRRPGGDPGTPSSMDAATPDSATYPDLRQLLNQLLQLCVLVTTNTERVLTHGLCAYCLSLQYDLPLPRSVTNILKDCVTGYMEHEVSPTEVENKCIVWISVVIASAVELSRDCDSIFGGVLDQALRRFPEMRRWDQLEQIMHTYLWHDDLAPHWQECWQNAMNRRTNLVNPTRSIPAGRPMALDTILNDR